MPAPNDDDTGFDDPLEPAEMAAADDDPDPTYRDPDGDGAREAEETTRVQPPG